MSEIEDLAGMLVPPPGEDEGVVQATIRSWDPDTFENVVEYDGLRDEDVDVGSGIEALTYQVGNVVLLRQRFPGGRRGERGLGTQYIERRIITPGTGAAEQAIAFMETALAARLARKIFGLAIRYSNVFNSGTRLNTAYGGLTPIGSVPTVDDIEVTDSGRLLVWAGATVSVAQDGTHTGLMSYDVDGPTTRAASDGWSYQIASFGDTALAVWPNIGAGRFSIQDGLTAGTYSLTAQYRNLTATGSGATFANPTLIAIPL